MFYAHSTGRTDKSDWQELKAHLEGVAALAEAFGAPLGIGKAARLAGLLHDLGKYNPEFQRRIAGENIQVDHSTAGAAIVRQLAKAPGDKIVAELIAYAIAGHHAGLPNKIDVAGSLDGRLSEFDQASIDAIWRSELSPDPTGLTPKLNFGTKHTGPFRVQLLGRMLFSCLVDADRKDSEAFGVATGEAPADRNWPPLKDCLPDFLARFERYMAAIPKADRPVNRVRAEVLQAVRVRAGMAPGLFTLTVPTGGGKTLASLGFALEHARLHGHRRIIYAIPFTSIIDQTAEIFRAVLGADNVLEHHSAIEEDKPSEFGARRAKSKLRLAMEDWAAPVVVTTNVQLFESLFAARPSQARKLHNIAGSIIILDEAQTLPRPLLAPSAQALDALAAMFGCTIVLCTATQPALDKRNFAEGDPMGLALEGRELAPDPARLARDLKRVRVERAGDMTNADLIAALRGVGQGLVIVNSRRHALDLFRQAQAAGLEGLVHLTTRQYAAHRRAILADVRNRLNAGEPCRVIATSLVEAGVDLDFPRGWRAEAGLDQIAQAAGRVNREGKRALEESFLFVFRAPDYPPPPEIEGLTGDVVSVAGAHPDLLTPAAIEAYFRQVYWRLGERTDSKDILGDFSLDATGTNFAYRCVAEKYRMIESGMLPVIIAKDEKARKAVEKLAIEDIPSGAIARDLQTFIVQVPRNAFDELSANGHVRYVHPDLREKQFAVLQTPGLYKVDSGLIWEDAGQMTLDQSIV